MMATMIRPIKLLSSLNPVPVCLVLVVGAVLAVRYGRRGEAVRTAVAGKPGLVPCGEGEIQAAAAEVGIRIPQPCMPGVAANLALLGRHAETLRGAAGAVR